MTIRFKLVCSTLVALGAAMLMLGCGSPLPPLAMDTDIFFVGVDASQGELTVPPGTRVDLGVYRRMSNGDITIITRKTEVDYSVNPPILDGRQTAVVEAGVLVAYYGDFLVSAVDRAQRFMNAEPLVVHVREGAPPIPSPIVITLPDGTVLTDGMVVVVGANGAMFLLAGGGPYSVSVLEGPFTVQVIDGAFVVTPIAGTAPGTYAVIIQITDASGQVRVIHITLTIEATSPPAVTGVTVDPSGSLTLQTDASQQFTASVQPAEASQAVVWSCTRGTITATGLYTAPATGGTDQVICVSVANSSVYVLVNIVVQPPAPTDATASVTVEALEGSDER